MGIRRPQDSAETPVGSVSACDRQTAVVVDREMRRKCRQHATPKDVQFASSQVSAIALDVHRSLSSIHANARMNADAWDVEARSPA